MTPETNTDLDPDLVCATRADIEAMEKRDRVRFVNSLPGFKGLMLVGTCDSSKQTNLSIISSCLHLGSDPPLPGMISRPTTVSRHTYENIQQTGVYTFNHIRRDFYPRAHQTSARYPREVSEFDATGLTEHWESEVDAPFVVESRLRIALKLAETIPVKTNGVIMIVGEVTHVFYPPEAQEQDRNLDLEVAGTIAGAGVNGYYESSRLDWLSYAKPDEPLPCFEAGIGDPSL